MRANKGVVLKSLLKFFLSELLLQHFHNRGNFYKLNRDQACEGVRIFPGLTFNASCIFLGGDT